MVICTVCDGNKSIWRRKTEAQARNQHSVSANSAFFNLVVGITVNVINVCLMQIFPPWKVQSKEARRLG